MALTDAQWAAEVANVVADLVAGTITAAEAEDRLRAATEDWPTRTLSNADLAARVSRFLARLNGLILTDGPPDIALGELNTFAYDTVNGALYGPKTVSGWGTPVSLVGPPGAAAAISGATITMLAPGADPTVTLGGTSSVRTFAFGVPAAADGDNGITPNVSAAVTMIAPGETALVTRSGPDSAPVFTFQLPRASDGTAGREVEMQGGATHLQWRYVGDADWINLFARADFKGDKGDKGDAFEFDATPANLAARDAYDAEADGFTVLVMDTGMVYARVGATAGLWSDGFPFGQTQNDILVSLSELSATPGLLYQSGAASFEKRTIGAAADADIPDRLSADGRYRRQDVAVPMAEVSGLSDALGDKADAAATLVLLGDKEDKAAKGQANGYAGLGADGKVPAGQLPAPPTVPTFATVAEVWAGTATDKIVPPSILKAALEFQALALASNVATMNCHAGINFTVPQLTANATLANPTNKVDARDGKINFSFDASARTLSVGSDWKKFAASPAIPTAANSKFTIVYSIIGTDVFYSVLVKP